MMAPVIEPPCPVVGVLAALEPELGSLPQGATPGSAALGIPILNRKFEAGTLLLATCGVGKVQAAHGAAALIGGGAEAVLVVGTCGGLSGGTEVGSLVHCQTAFQADLAIREGRQVEPDPELLHLWRSVAAGPAGWFLTADRPVLTAWRRLRLARAFRGICVADMETAAAAAVAVRARVPWAALRAVSDRAGPGSARSFRDQLPRVGGLAADTVPDFAVSDRVGDGSALSVS